LRVCCHEKDERRKEEKDMSFKIGNAPTSWGIEKPEAKTNPPWQKVLDDMSNTGYAGTELGPLGFLPTDPGHLREELSQRNLQLIAGTLMDNLHDPDVAEKLRKTTHSLCALLQELEAPYLVVIAGMADERVKTAGRSQAARRLDEDEWAVLVNTVATCAEVARNDYGVIPVVHPHAGTHIEFIDEIERLLGQTDPNVVELCIDTGHSAYAGIDPLQLYRSFGERTPYLHLKDIDPGVHQKALDAGMSFWEAYSAGIFCSLGSGVGDFEALREMLQKDGYEGWLTVEQDADPTGDSDPKEDAARSLEYLQTVGLADSTAKEQ
jgi:inosose dehydratase